VSVVYLDSSALIKRYLEEPGSDQVRRIFGGEAPLLVSVIAWSECLAALFRRRQDGTLSARVMHGPAMRSRRNGIAS